MRQTQQIPIGERGGARPPPLAELADAWWSADLIESIALVRSILGDLSNDSGFSICDVLLRAEAQVGIAASNHGGAATDHYYELLGTVMSEERITPDTLRGWHTVVAEGSPAVDPGRFRQGARPIAPDLDVLGIQPTPPAEIERLVEDLVAYANRSFDDPVVKAALMYRQVQLIQPFTGGNGRLARLCLYWAMSRAWGVIPPIALIWASDAARYETGFNLMRSEDPEQWIQHFVGDFIHIGSLSRDLRADLTRVHAEWIRSTPGRSRSLHRTLLDGLISHPYVDSGTAMARYDADATRFSRVARDLVSAGVLVVLPPVSDGVGRPRRRYVAPVVIEALDRWVASVRRRAGFMTGPVTVPGQPAAGAAATRIATPNSALRPPIGRKGRPVPSKVRRPSVS